MLNQVAIMGFVTKDLENKTEKLAKTTLAFNKKILKNNEWVEETSFFELTVFGDKNIKRYKKILKKGNKVIITGELTENKWQNKEGKKRKRVEIIVKNAILVHKKEEEEKGSKK